MHLLLEGRRAFLQVGEIIDYISRYIPKIHIFYKLSSYDKTEGGGKGETLNWL